MRNTHKIVPVDVVCEIWDVLVKHCGARPPEPDSHFCMRADLVHHAATGDWTEFRFQGNLGFGGKVWNTSTFAVSAYQDDQTPEMKLAMSIANAALDAIKLSFESAKRREA